jgi:hypothetical protein
MRDDLFPAPSGFSFVPRGKRIVPNHFVEPHPIALEHQFKKTSDRQCGPPGTDFVFLLGTDPTRTRVASRNFSRLRVEVVNQNSQT